MRSSSCVLLIALLVGLTETAHSQIIRRPPPGQPTPADPNTQPFPPERGRLFGPRTPPNQPQPAQPQPLPKRDLGPQKDYSADLAKSVAKWESLFPKQPADYATVAVDDLIKEGLDMEQWAADVSLYDPDAPPTTVLKMVSGLLDLKDRVDRRLKNTLELRGEIGAFVTAESGRNIARNYLRVTSSLIDLSGRFRFLLYDLLEDLAGEFATQPGPREQLINLLCDRKSSIGAEVMSLVLSDPPPTAPAGVRPVSPNVKLRILKLIAETGQADLLPEVIKLLRTPNVPAHILLQAGETIQQVGLPQEPRPGQDPTLPKPAIGALDLWKIVSQIPLSSMDNSQVKRRKDLLDWLAGRVRGGVTEDSFRMCGFDVQPGDWLLMRNPSPYNLFTDLSPGLFTHVGVVAAENGKDGLRRFVLVDLPERGSSIPATNVEIFVDRTRHYVFLRHPDASAAKKMGETAAAVIGNESLFDLNFRTDRVQMLKGQSLVGQKIHTYCAGFLQLCAQETGLPRPDFFPVPEFPAGGKFTTNLKTLGMSIGEQFISPTGALFSAKLKVVGTREPMYDARREIEETIFNHFARRMEEQTLVASPDAGQILRQKLAEASKGNPLLAKALAEAANVNASIDLVAAAKAAAVVESLDDVAYGASGEFRDAYRVITNGLPNAEQLARLTKAERDKVQVYRTRHASLCGDWDKEEITPRGVRFNLVLYYVQDGRAQIDKRFFQPKSVLSKPLEQ